MRVTAQQARASITTLLILNFLAVGITTASQLLEEEKDYEAFYHRWRPDSIRALARGYFPDAGR
jgi:hypothetical protein